MANIENLGLYLKQLREERKIPIIQIAQVLKTKPETIQAIEANEFHKIPAPTYVKGYLRSYAVYLEIDCDQVIAEYNRQFPDKTKQVLILQGKKIPRLGPGIKNIFTPKLILYIIIIIIAASAITAAVIFWPTNQPPPARPQEEVKIEPEVITPVSMTTAVSLPITLKAQARDNVWLRIYSDGKLVFEGILKKDDQETWQAEKDFQIRIGNPGKLILSLNDQLLGCVSPYGPVNVVINENGVKVDK